MKRNYIEKNICRQISCRSIVPATFHKVVEHFYLRNNLLIPFSKTKLVNERFYIKINFSPIITQFLCIIGRKNPLETLEHYFERKSITFFNNTLIQSKRLCFCERMCIDMLRQQILSLFHHQCYITSCIDE